MKKAFLTLSAAALLLAACNESTQSADNKKDSATMNSSSTEAAKEPETKKPAAMPDSATAMKNWMAYSTPGATHKMMASWNGTWDGDVTMWEKPGAPPQTSKTVSTNKMIMDGRYQVSEHNGNMMGMPFQGMSTLAYDNAMKMFISTWVDNMGTGMMKMEGNWDEAAKSLNLSGKCVDPAMGDGTECNVREVTKIIDDKHQVMEMYMVGPDGKEFKSMEIKYTRK